MVKKKRNTNRPHIYANKQRDLVLIAKFRPFDEERWKQLLTAMAYELAKQKKARSGDSSSASEESTPPQK